MEEAAVVITVADEAVSARVVATGIEHRPVVVELVAQHGQPLRLGEILIVHMVHVASVFEVVAQRVLGTADGGRAKIDDAAGGFIIVVGAAAAFGQHVIVHLDSHPNMVHQGGHRRFLSRGCRRDKAVGHAAPSIGSGAEIGAQGAISGMGVGVGAIAGSGMVPVFHYLSRRRGHTAGHRPFGVVAVVGAEVVVIRVLIPTGGEKRGYRCEERQLGSHAVVEHVPLSPQRGLSGGAVGGEAVGRQVLIEPNLGFAVVEPPADVGGHSFHREDLGGGKAQDGHHTVVARHQYKAPSVGADEGIEFTIGHGGRDVGQFHLSRPIHFQIVGCNPARLLHVDGVGLCHSHPHSNHQDKQYNSFHIL